MRRPSLILACTIVLLLPALATRGAETPPAAAWSDKPMAALTAWRLAPLSRPVIAPGATRVVSATAPEPNDAARVEALLPGSAPQLARFPGLFLRQGEWSSVAFTGSTDTLAALLEEDAGGPVLRLRVHVDGRELPEVALPLREDRRGGGLAVAGAPDGTCYALGATIVSLPLGAH